MTFPGRDGGEVDALVTDRYLDALLAGDPTLTSLDHPAGWGPAAGRGRRGGVRGDAAIDAAVRAASRRLAADLPRFHPSFRFEERLALRLAETAAAMRLPMAAGGETDVARIPVAPGFDPLGVVPDDEELAPQGAAVWRGAVRGAVAASAISLAGAAWYAWRHRPAASPMARAARAAHAARRA